MSDYRNNHYVAQWYQKRFLPERGREQKFYYLDLRPEKVKQGGRSYTRAALLRWGTPRCFVERDLYTTRFGSWFSTEIEQRYFGQVDPRGRRAVDYFTGFAHPSVDSDALQDLMQYMTLQRLRTPTGLAALAEMAKLGDRNAVLMAMQSLARMYGAIWTEAVWSIADASLSPTKFIVSDHPVTLYNPGCFPRSKWCRGHRDPDIRMAGTHTIFPLSRDKLLILTNLSWVRNPYGSPLAVRPNPELFRGAMFNFLDIQVGRVLSEQEVWEINWVIKQRARRYLAAAEEEWLYPERHLADTRWDGLGGGYLFMPDPRGVSFTTGIAMGYMDGSRARVDEYGHVPGQPGFRDDGGRDHEFRTFQAFKGEFARVFGPRRRGQGYRFNGLESEEDSPELHSANLRAETRHKPAGGSRVKRRRPRYS